FLQCNPEDIYPNIIIYDKGIEIPKSTSFLGNFFNNSNLRLFDTNSYGALLFKIAVFIICIDSFLYLGFRLLGYTYAPFIGGNDILGQLLWGWVIFTYPMSFILPLIIRHWSVYIITLLTFKGILDFVFDIWGKGIMSNWGHIIPHNILIIQTIISFFLTLGYAWVVKTYLRKPINTKTV
ncbi:MAG: hypothetical protein LBH40_02590, partial [Alphaproteobacteria bacterium]|nr:hypothetical protein [Alphaproteobacteria bacterium]